MLFIVKFEDHPERMPSRAAALDAHLQWLDRHRDVVLVGGSLRKAPDANPVGGLWIVEADSKQQIVDLVASDPFSLAGLRKSVEIFHWSKAFEQRRVAV